MHKLLGKNECAVAISNDTHVLGSIIYSFKNGSKIEMMNIRDVEIFVNSHNRKIMIM